ncbi:UBA/THIF-type NAD/FAD binding protein [Nitritalea halalkaliphila LW7]|uniref:UBA/THIF-type NAD/FAD binding protein n=1 Tax=Nitritalea halalkaliphila LW7 TaxID=1189621 RepID=I5C7M5_9BACT|nr:rhodanese-like domain-containing protein [Nitritalea halalkaliphila]EIM77827.1 UBA/THIF-type NAD/FAD binding protein [Nitritalea halalkaliphila LW7]
MFSLNGYRTQAIRLVADPKGREAAPATWEALLAENYAVPCSLEEEEIPWETALRQAKTQQTLLLDVREKEEQPKLGINPKRLLELPLSRLEKEAARIFGPEIAPRKVAVFCQSGVRSKRAVIALKSQFPAHEFIGIAGGINAWINHNNDGQ